MHSKKQDDRIGSESLKTAKKEVTTKITSSEESTKESIPKETGGRTQGLEPTRYGDWEFKGRCIDF